LIDKDWMLALLGSTGSQHFVQKYSELREDTGQGTHRFDHGMVHRIFFEFCENGDLSSWRDKLRDAR